MEFVVDKAPSYKQFVNNMQEKMEDADFINDTQSFRVPEINIIFICKRCLSPYLRDIYR